jgi:hypothetical protein
LSKPAVIDRTPSNSRISLISSASFPPTKTGSLTSFERPEYAGDLSRGRCRTIDLM